MMSSEQMMFSISELPCNFFVRLFAKRSKCQFRQPDAEFFGHTFSHKGMEMAPYKVDAVRDWPQLRSTKDIQRFLGLTGCYRKFVKGYAELAFPLYGLLGKKVSLSCGTNRNKHLKP
jgi:hypothetical protein